MQRIRNITNKPLICVGYDSNEPLAYNVCVKSMMHYASKSPDIMPMDIELLRRSSLYRRSALTVGAYQVDTQDERPFSTEFAFSRFLSPIIGQVLDRDYVIFVDSDFMFRSDIYSLMDCVDEGASVSVVKHDYRSYNKTKMRGHVPQQAYNRKLWSALMVFNCSHPDVRNLTTYQANYQPGSWLHGFEWTSDGSIGALPHAWHWVPGHSHADIIPHAVHYTMGTPDVPGHEEEPYSGEWKSFAEQFTS